MKQTVRLPILAVMLTGGWQGAAVAAASPPSAGSINYELAAREVMRHIQTTFYLPKNGLYAHSVKQRYPDFMWGDGVMFTALLGAVRHDPQTYGPMLPRFFKSLNSYWDSRDRIPGYEPAPTNGDGHDKYYDDNAWIVLACLEAYQMTHEQQYLTRAEQTLKFVLSGWDEQRGGGIWWQEKHEGDCKNTCVNAPAAVGCLRIANYLSPSQAINAIAMAQKIVRWTTQTLQCKDGLFADNIKVATGKVDRNKFTYNTALMIRAYLRLYHATGNERYIEQAKRSALASNWFLDPQTHAYRGTVKFSHLLVEADLALFRTTGQQYLWKRAQDNSNYEYKMWKQQPSDELIINASVARTLWLMADMQSVAGRRFWRQMDREPSVRP